MHRSNAPRGLQIVRLAAEGKTDKEIALLLGLSTSTIKTYWTRVRTQFNAASRGETIAKMFREVADRHVMLLETMPDGMVIIQDDAITFANTSIAKLMRYDSPQDLVGLTGHDILEPTEVADARRARNELLPGEVVRRELRYRRRDGTSFRAEASATPAEWEGQPATIVLIRDREKEIASERRREALLDAVPDLLFVLSPEGVYLDYRESQVLKPALSPESFMGKNYREIMPPDNSAAITRAMHELRDGATHSVFFYELPEGDEVASYVCWMTPMTSGNIMASIRRLGSRPTSV